jgi:hypothetical protein
MQVERFRHAERVAGIVQELRSGGEGPIAGSTEQP